LSIKEPLGNIAKISAAHLWSTNLGPLDLSKQCSCCCKLRVVKPSKSHHRAASSHYW